ncbi:MAG: T9SS type A sorting domain-containing protein [Bacteroidota bacterium]
MSTTTRRKNTLFAFFLVVLLPLAATPTLGQSAFNAGNNSNLSVQRSCDIYEASGGMVVIETESDDPADSWTLQNGLSGATGSGYYEWKHGNNSMGIDGAGQGVLSYPIEFPEAGTYRFLFRTAAPDKTEHNDAWIRFPDNNAEGRKSNGGSVTNLGQNTWFKVYQNKGSDIWNFVAHTVDNNAHQVFALIDTPGVYRLEMSGRSTLFKVDRFVLFNDTVSESTATDLANAESGCSSLPVELTSFSGLADGTSVSLGWETASELNNAGFDVEFGLAADGAFSKVGFVAGAGTADEAQRYSYSHNPEAFAGQTVYYRLKQLDFDGAFEYSDVIAVALPATAGIMLHPAYPNPFNPEATISFTLATEKEVALSVYDTSGRLVEELINGVREAGFHSEKFQPASDMASGMYLYRLVTPSQTLSGTVMLLK